MKEQTDWEKTAAALEGMQRAAMPAVLRERIIAALPKAARSINLRGPVIMLMAAGLALLIGINVYSLAQNAGNKRGGEVVVQSNPLADEYFAPAPSI